MRARDPKSIIIVGIILIIVSTILVFFTKYWYYLAVFGVWFLFDYFSSMKNKDTAIQLFANNKKGFWNLYLIMLSLGMAIEYLGRFIFAFWYYPTPQWMEIFIILLYPLMFFSLREMYETFSLLVKNKVLTVIVSIIVGIIIWEVPNLVSKSWIYTIPFGFEIIGINIFVIIGWVLLIMLPKHFYEIFFKGDKK